MDQDSARSLAALAGRAFRWVYDQPALLLVTTMTIWAGNTILGRYIAGEIPPFGLTFFRWTIAFAVVLPFAWPHLKRDLPLILHHWKAMVLVSATGAAGFNALNYYGLQDTTALNGLIFHSSSPLLIALFGFILFRDRLAPIQAVGIALSFIGVLTVVLRGDIAVLLTLSFNPGDVWLLAAMSCNGIFSPCLRLAPKIHWLSFLAVTSALAPAILLVPMLVELGQGKTMPADLQSLAVLAYVALGASLVALLCFHRGVELMGANRAGAFFHVHPMVGSIMAIVLLGERPALFHGIGFALIMAGVALATRRAKR